jgi:methyl-accepting chemotaxis protein
MAASPYQRKRYLVDSGYQLRFVTRLFLAVFAVAVASALLASGLVWRHLYLQNPEANAPLLVSSLVAIAVTLLIELLLAIPILFILGVRQTHRVVGSFTRLRQTLQAIGSGEFSRRVELRQGDALEDVARSINKMAAKLQERFSRG